MAKSVIEVADLALQPFTTFNPSGVLLLSGTGIEHCNVMTISWGMFGIMWGKPVVMAMVRPTRHTWEFIIQSPDFTINWLPDDWTDALNLCGSKSGRDTDKFGATGLTPVPGCQTQSPILEQSALSLECRILYTHTLDAGKFLDPSIIKLYPAQDFHDLFFGEIVAATGVEDFRCR